MENKFLKELKVRLSNKEHELEADPPWDKNPEDPVFYPSQMDMDLQEAKNYFAEKKVYPNYAYITLDPDMYSVNKPWRVMEVETYDERFFSTIKDVHLYLSKHEQLTTYPEEILHKIRKDVTKLLPAYMKQDFSNPYADGAFCDASIESDAGVLTLVVLDDRDYFYDTLIYDENSRTWNFQAHPYKPIPYALPLVPEYQMDQLNKSIVKGESEDEKNYNMDAVCAHEEVKETKVKPKRKKAKTR